MSISLATRGLYGAEAGASGSDTTAPVITVVSLPTLTTDPAVIEVYDETGLTFYHISCLDNVGGPRLTVYDPIDGGFVHPFNGRSTLTGAGTSGDPYVFTVYRRGRWPTGNAITLDARAIDVGGNETDS